MIKPEKKIISHSNNTIEYLVCGEGKKTIFFIHGLLSLPECFFIFLSSVPSHWLSMYKIILPYLPGATPNSKMIPTPHHIDDYATWLLPIFEEEKIEKTVMLGHSMGGYITIAFADLYPTKLHGYGFIASMAQNDTEAIKMMRKEMCKIVKTSNDLSFVIKTMVPNNYSKKSIASQPHLVQQAIARSLTYTAEDYLQQQGIILTRPNRQHLLRNSSLPIFFLLGTLDGYITYQREDVQISQSPFVSYLDDIGHCPLEEDVYQSFLSIRNYLDAIHY